MTIYKNTFGGTGETGAYTDTPLLYYPDLSTLGGFTIILDIDELDPNDEYEELHVRFGSVISSGGGNTYFFFSDDDRVGYTANVDGIRVRQGQAVNTVQQFIGVDQVLFAPSIGRSLARGAAGAIIIRNHKTGQYLQMEGRCFGVDTSANEGVKTLLDASTSHITDIKITFGGTNLTGGYFAVFGRKYSSP